MVLCEAQARHKVRGNGRKRGKGEHGVLGDVAKIAKVFRKGGRHGADFVCHLLVHKSSLMAMKRGCAVEQGGLIGKIMPRKGRGCRLGIS